mgnify:CR=1 FL=1
MRRLRELEQAYPQFADASSPTRKVGGKAKREAGVLVRHNVPMLSLQDVFSREEVDAFVEEMREKLDHPEGKREGGIGLSNVANRIYHFFGREAQIPVESEPDQGTKVILTLPYPKNREIMLKEENEESEDEWNEIY